MSYDRGDIYFVDQAQPHFGSEQNSGRPAIIVSSDAGNRYSSVLEVVYLTTQPKKDLPTHVQIQATGVISTALCEQIQSVDCRRIGRFCGRCSDDEMQKINAALVASLGLAENFSGNFLAKTIVKSDYKC